MLKEAIIHRADSDMCYLTDDGNVIITVKAQKGDLSQVVMIYDDRYDRNPVLKPIRMALDFIMSDELYDYFGIEFTCRYKRMCYYFELVDKQGSHLFFYQDGFSLDYRWNRQQLFQLPYLHLQDTPHVPKWLKESIMYQIFPDSFANGKEKMEECPASFYVKNDIKVESRFGGTIRGIIENLSYIKDLGVTLLYLNPVFTAGSYHKYDEVDYFTVDPCLGTNEDLKELADKCHQIGLRLMLDIVFNQSSASFFAFQDVLEKGEASEYADWYHIHSFPVKRGKNPNYETFAFYDVMPKFNTDNPKVLDYLLDIARFWIRECDIDGYRLDVANELPHEFWRRFRYEVDQLKTDFALVGEVWHDAASWLGRNQFHSVMNYPLMYAIWEFFGLNSLSAYQFSQTVNRLTMKYRRDHTQVMMNFIDNHDVGRFISLTNLNYNKQKMAAAFLMTYVGMPSIYYGDEKSLEGRDINDSRRKMIWEDNDTSADMYDYYKRLTRIRTEYNALTHGRYVPLIADAATNLYGFIREDGEEQIACIFNNTEIEQKLTVRLKGDVCRDLLSDESFEKQDGEFCLTMKPSSSRILKIM